MKLRFSHVSVLNALLAGTLLIGALPFSAKAKTTIANTATATPSLAEALVTAQAKTTFSDVPSDFWANSYIEALTEKGMITGYLEGDFRPDAFMTRAEFAALLSKAFPSANTRQPMDFPDIDSNYWGLDAIKKAYSTGFLIGYDDGAFKPSQNISRGEVLVALASGLGYSPERVSSETVRFYRDSNSIPDWMVANIAAATEQQIVINYPDVQSLKPEQAATRAEVVAMVYRALSNTDIVPFVSSEYDAGSSLSSILVAVDTLKTTTEREPSAFEGCLYGRTGRPLNYISPEEQSEYTPTARAIDKDSLLSCSNLEKNEISAIAYLSEDSWKTFDSALNTLWKSEIDYSVIELRSLLKDPELLLQEAATYALGQKGEPAAAAVPDLIESLQTSPSATVRENAIQALGRISPGNADVEVALITVLLKKYEYYNVQSTAADVLVEIAETPSANILEALVEVFSNFQNENEIREHAGSRLQDISLETISTETVAKLVNRLDFDNDSPQLRSCLDTIRILSKPNAQQKLSEIVQSEDFSRAHEKANKLLDLIASEPNPITNAAAACTEGSDVDVETFRAALRKWWRW